MVEVVSKWCDKNISLWFDRVELEVGKWLMQRHPLLLYSLFWSIPVFHSLFACCAACPRENYSFQSQAPSNSILALVGGMNVRESKAPEVVSSGGMVPSSKLNPEAREWRPPVAKLSKATGEWGPCMAKPLNPTAKEWTPTWA